MVVIAAMVLEVLAPWSGLGPAAMDCSLETLHSTSEELVHQLRKRVRLVVQSCQLYSNSKNNEASGL